MDLTRKRYANFEELRLYCYRVASAVGLICIEIFGYTNPAARIYAEKLGIAFQLTNILRDVKEDAGRGRIYLPLEDLARFDVTEEEILHSVYSPNFVRLMEFEAARAQDFYREAEAALPAEDRSSLADRRGDAPDLRRAARSHRAVELSRARSPPQLARAAEALPGRARVGLGPARARCEAETMIEAKDVIIIGGGFAGLSAGVALAEKGFRVALLKSKPALGGRAYSFADPKAATSSTTASTC